MFVTTLIHTYASPKKLHLTPDLLPLPVWCGGQGYTWGMESAPRIADRIDEDVAGIVACWQTRRGGEDEDGAHDRMLAGMEELVSVFVGFLRSSETVATYSRGGATRALVEKIASYQHALGRDAVGVIEDFVVLRRCIWHSVESGVDLSELHGAEVSGFFAKLMQASDWLTETGLEAFDAIVRREMEQALGRAAATDLVTGLPDRDQLNRLLLPRAIDAHDQFSVAVFTGTVAAGKVKRARKTLRTLADAVQETSPEGSTFARFGDDEVCVIVAEETGEGAFRLAERVLERLAEQGADFEVDVGIAEYPAHGKVAGELMAETLKALNMAKRVGGSGIVIAR
jgi:GGDEF domain-containing protein